MTKYLPFVLLAGGLLAVVILGLPDGGLKTRWEEPTPPPPDPLIPIRAEIAELRDENAALRTQLETLAALPDRLDEVEARVGVQHAPAARPLHSYAVPDEVEFCGTSIPMDDPAVRLRFENEWNRFLINRHWVVAWMRRARDAYPPVEAKLAAAGLPDDLKYVMTIESALEARAYSSAGAVGYWQFVRDTGKRYGLRRTTLIDERRNLDLATDAAIAYLTKLHAEFGSWPLALAAYNCGERRVRDEIEAQGSDDYFQMVLPRETEAYVFKAAAVKVLFENPKRYGFILPDDGWQPKAYDSIRVTVKNKLEFRELCEAAGLTYREFKTLNPQYRTSHVTKGTYPIVLPQGSTDAVLARYPTSEVVERAPVYAAETETPTGEPAATAPAPTSGPPR